MSGPSSYIPTTTAAVTRSADQLKIDGTDFSDFYNQSEGTVFCEFAAIAYINQRMFSISDGTYDEHISGIFSTSGGGGLFFQITDGGVTQANLPTATTPDSDTFYKMAGAWKDNDFAVSRYGGAVSTDSLVTIPTVDRLYIGGSAISAPLNGYIKRLAYYPKRLTNTELQALSA